MLGGFEAIVSLPRCVIRKRPLPVFSSSRAIVRCARAQASRFVNTGRVPLGNSSFRFVALAHGPCALRRLARSS